MAGYVVNGKINVFAKTEPETNIHLPEVVYIIATGKMGLSHHDFIRGAGHCIISVNQAINYNLPHDIWFISDSTVYRELWFQENKDRVVMRVFSKELIRNGKCQAEYMFEQRKPMTRPSSNLEWGCCRPNGSVSISALQFAYWCGSKVIILCGADMTGRYRVYNPIASGVVAQIKERGVRVYSLSATNIEGIEYL